MRQTRSSTLSWKKCLVRATGTSSWRFLGGTSVCVQWRATQHSTSFIPMPLLGGIISPTRGSYCFRDARSILLVSKRCWPQAQAPSWSFKTMFMPRHAEHLSAVSVCVTVLQLIAGSLAVLKHRHTPARHNYNRHHLPCHRKAYQ